MGEPVPRLGEKANPECLSDEQLIEAIRAGSPGTEARRASTELHARYAAMVFSTAYKVVRDVQAASDVSQQTWLDFFLYLERYIESGRLGALLKRMTHLRAKNYVRANVGIPSVSLDSKEAMNVRQRGAEALDLVVRRETYEASRLRLTPSQRFAVDLWLDGVSVEEIAAHRGWSVAYTANLISAARGEFRRE